MLWPDRPADLCYPAWAAAGRGSDAARAPHASLDAPQLARALSESAAHGAVCPARASAGRGPSPRQVV